MTINAPVVPRPEQLVAPVFEEQRLAVGQVNTVGGGGGGQRLLGVGQRAGREERNALWMYVGFKPTAAAFAGGQGGGREGRNVMHFGWKMEVGFQVGCGQGLLEEQERVGI